MKVQRQTHAMKKHRKSMTENTSHSGPATKARRGLGYKRKISNAVGYLIHNEISWSLSSHRGKQGILSTDIVLKSHCWLSLRSSLWLVLCFPVLPVSCNQYLLSVFANLDFSSSKLFPRFWISKLDWFCGNVSFYEDTVELTFVWIALGSVSQSGPSNTFLKAAVMFKQSEQRVKGCPGARQAFT